MFGVRKLDYFFITYIEDVYNTCIDKCINVVCTYLKAAKSQKLSSIWSHLQKDQRNHCLSTFQPTIIESLFSLIPMNSYLRNYTTNIYNSKKKRGRRQLAYNKEQRL